MISNGSCISTAVRLKRLRASVLICPFPIKHDTLRTDELHPPANERSHSHFAYYDENNPRGASSGNTISSRALLWLRHLVAIKVYS